MWERGLKLGQPLDRAAVRRSLPMWERGLKLPPVRERDDGARRSPCGSVD